MSGPRGMADIDVIASRHCGGVDLSPTQTCFEFMTMPVDPWRLGKVLAEGMSAVSYLNASSQSQRLQIHDSFFSPPIAVEFTAPLLLYQYVNDINGPRSNYYGFDSPANLYTPKMREQAFALPALNTAEQWGIYRVLPGTIGLIGEADYKVGEVWAHPHAFGGAWQVYIEHASIVARVYP